MSRHYRRLIKSIRKLGLSNGCFIFYIYLYHRLISQKKLECRQVKLTNISKPIWLRPGVSDWIVMERIFLDQEYDPMSAIHDKAMDKLEHSIIAEHKRPLIIDCGANIGLSSVWLAERFPNSIVVAIEPESDNFKILTLNTKNFPNIIPLNAAISDRMSNVILSNDLGTPWAWKTQETNEGGIQAVTVQHVIDLDKDYVLMAMKVDIEGFEVNLFRDEAKWVDNLPFLVFEMHDWMTPWSGSGHAFFSNLSKHRRDYLIQGENVFSYSHRMLQH